MTQYTKVVLLKTKKEILNQVEEGKLGVKTAAHLLGITRQGLWKLRKNFKEHGNLALIGRKRGPKSWFRVHNRTPEWAEEKVEKIYLTYGGGPDTLLWVIEDYYHDELGWINLSRSTIYRILVRRRLLFPKASQKINHHPHKYTKWKGPYFFFGNTSLRAKLCFQHFLASAPFPVQEEECLWRIPPKQRTNQQAINYALAQHNQWYNCSRRHLGYQMERKTPQQKIEDWIINNQTSPEFSGEVNETLIFYIIVLNNYVYVII